MNNETNVNETNINQTSVNETNVNQATISEAPVNTTNNVEVNTTDRTPQELLQQTGANYVETGSTPRHVDTSTLDKKKNPFGTIFSILLLILVLGWSYIMYTDYTRVNNKKEPKYCIWQKTEEKFENGTITSCTGLGYKVIHYNKTSEDGDNVRVDELVPIWIKTKTLDEI